MKNKKFLMKVLSLFVCLVFNFTNVAYSIPAGLSVDDASEQLDIFSKVGNSLGEELSWFLNRHLEEYGVLDPYDHSLAFEVARILRKEPDDRDEDFRRMSAYLIGKSGLSQDSDFALGLRRCLDLLREIDLTDPKSVNFVKSEITALIPDGEKALMPLGEEDNLGEDLELPFRTYQQPEELGGVLRYLNLDPAYANLILQHLGHREMKAQKCGILIFGDKALAMIIEAGKKVFIVRKKKDIGSDSWCAPSPYLGDGRLVPLSLEDLVRERLAAHLGEDKEFYYLTESNKANRFLKEIEYSLLGSSEASLKIIGFILGLNPPDGQASSLGVRTETFPVEPVKLGNKWYTSQKLFSSGFSISLYALPKYIVADKISLPGVGLGDIESVESIQAVVVQFPLWTCPGLVVRKEGKIIYIESEAVQELKDAKAEQTLEETRSVISGALKNYFEDYEFDRVVCPSENPENFLKSTTAVAEDDFSMSDNGFVGASPFAEDGISPKEIKVTVEETGGEETQEQKKEAEHFFSTYVIGAKSGDRIKITIDPMPREEVEHFIHGKFKSMFRWFAQFMQVHDRYKEVGKRFHVLKACTARGIIEGLCVYEVDESGLNIWIIEVSRHNTEREGVRRKLKGVGSRLVEALVRISKERELGGRIYILPRARRTFFKKAGFIKKNDRDYREWFVLENVMVNYFLDTIDGEMERKRKAVLSKPFKEPLLKKEDLRHGSRVKIEDLPEGKVKQFIEYLSRENFDHIVLYGGAVRNLLLNKTPSDFDIVIKADSVKSLNHVDGCLFDFGKALFAEAERILDERDGKLSERLKNCTDTEELRDIQDQQADIVKERKRIKEKKLDFMHKTVDETLEYSCFPIDYRGIIDERGFVQPDMPIGLSINEIGVKIVGDEVEFIDPYGGIEDFRKKIARFVGPDLEEKPEMEKRFLTPGPTRLLKTVLFMDLYQLKLDDQSRELMKDFAREWVMDPFADPNYVKSQIKKKLRLLFRFSHDQKVTFELLDSLGIHEKLLTMGINVRSQKKDDNDEYIVTYGVNGAIPYGDETDVPNLPFPKPSDNTGVSGDTVDASSLGDDIEVEAIRAEASGPLKVVYLDADRMREKGYPLEEEDTVGIVFYNEEELIAWVILRAEEKVLLVKSLDRKAREIWNDRGTWSFFTNMFRKREVVDVTYGKAYKPFWTRPVTAKVRRSESGRTTYIAGIDIEKSRGDGKTGAGAGSSLGKRRESEGERWSSLRNLKIMLSVNFPCQRDILPRIEVELRSGRNEKGESIWLEQSSEKNAETGITFVHYLINIGSGISEREAIEWILKTGLWENLEEWSESITLRRNLETRLKKLRASSLGEVGAMLPLSELDIRVTQNLKVTLLNRDVFSNEDSAFLLRLLNFDVSKNGTQAGVIFANGREEAIALVLLDSDRGITVVDKSNWMDLAAVGGMGMTEEQALDSLKIRLKNSYNEVEFVRPKEGIDYSLGYPIGPEERRKIRLTVFDLPQEIEAASLGEFSSEKTGKTGFPTELAAAKEALESLVYDNRKNKLSETDFIVCRVEVDSAWNGGIGHERIRDWKNRTFVHSFKLNPAVSGIELLEFALALDKRMWDRRGSYTGRGNFSYIFKEKIERKLEELKKAAVRKSRDGFISGSSLGEISKLEQARFVWLAAWLKKFKLWNDHTEYAKKRGRRINVSSPDEEGEEEEYIVSETKKTRLSFKAINIGAFSEISEKMEPFGDFYVRQKDGSWKRRYVTGTEEENIDENAAVIRLFVRSEDVHKNLDDAGKFTTFNHVNREYVIGVTPSVRAAELLEWMLDYDNSFMRQFFDADRAYFWNYKGDHVYPFTEWTSMKGRSILRKALNEWQNKDARRLSVAAEAIEAISLADDFEYPVSGDERGVDVLRDALDQDVWTRGIHDEPHRFGFEDEQDIKYTLNWLRNHERNEAEKLLVESESVAKSLGEGQEKKYGPLMTEEERFEWLKALFPTISVVKKTTVRGPVEHHIAKVFVDKIRQGYAGIYVRDARPVSPLKGDPEVFGNVVYEKESGGRWIKRDFGYADPKDEINVKDREVIWVTATGPYSTWNNETSVSEKPESDATVPNRMSYVICVTPEVTAKELAEWALREDNYLFERLARYGFDAAWMRLGIETQLGQWTSDGSSLGRHRKNRVRGKKPVRITREDINQQLTKLKSPRKGKIREALMVLAHWARKNPRLFRKKDAESIQFLTEDNDPQIAQAAGHALENLAEHRPDLVKASSLGENKDEIFMEELAQRLRELGIYLNDRQDFFVERQLTGNLTFGMQEMAFLGQAYYENIQRLLDKLGKVTELAKNLSEEPEGLKSRKPEFLFLLDSVLNSITSYLGSLLKIRSDIEGRDTKLYAADQVKSELFRMLDGIILFAEKISDRKEKGDYRLDLGKIAEGIFDEGMPAVEIPSGGEKAVLEYPDESVINVRPFYEGETFLRTLKGHIGRNRVGFVTDERRGNFAANYVYWVSREEDGRFLVSLEINPERKDELMGIIKDEFYITVRRGVNDAHSTKAFLESEKTDLTGKDPLLLPSLPESWEMMEGARFGLIGEEVLKIDFGGGEVKIYNQALEIVSDDTEAGSLGNIEAVVFDLNGTLLPLNRNEITSELKTNLRLLIEKFKSKGIKIGIASGAAIDDVKAALESLGISGLVDHIVMGKWRESFVLLSEKLGVDLGRMLMLDDEEVFLKFYRHYGVALAKKVNGPKEILANLEAWIEEAEDESRSDASSLGRKVRKVHKTRLRKISGGHLFFQAHHNIPSHTGISIKDSFGPAGFAKSGEKIIEPQFDVGTFFTYVIGARSGNILRLWMDSVDSEETEQFVKGEYASMFRWFSQFMLKGEKYKKVGEKYKVLKVHTETGNWEGVCVYKIDKKGKHGLGAGVRVEIIEVARHNTEREGKLRKLRGVGRRMMQAIVEISRNAGCEGRVFIEPKARRGFFKSLGFVEKMSANKRTQWLVLEPAQAEIFLSSVEAALRETRKEIISKPLPELLINAEGLKHGSRIKIKDIPDSKGKHFIQFLADNGLENFVLYGGAVRNLLLNRTPSDFDVLLEKDETRKTSGKKIDFAFKLFEAPLKDIYATEKRLQRIQSKARTMRRKRSFDKRLDKLQEEKEALEKEKEDIPYFFDEKGFLHFYGFPVDVMGVIDEKGRIIDVRATKIDDDGPVNETIPPDLTINRIGVKVVGDEIEFVDFYGGISDFKNRTGRLISEFDEEESSGKEPENIPTEIRILRMARFIDQFGLELTPRSRSILKRYVESAEWKEDEDCPGYLEDGLKEKLTLIFRFSENQGKTFGLLEELGIVRKLREFGIKPLGYIVTYGVEGEIPFGEASVVPNLPFPKPEEAGEASSLGKKTRKGRREDKKKVRAQKEIEKQFRRFIQGKKKTKLDALNRLELIALESPEAFDEHTKGTLWGLVEDKNKNIAGSSERILTLLDKKTGRERESSENKAQSLGSEEKAFLGLASGVTLNDKGEALLRRLANTFLVAIEVAAKRVDVEALFIKELNLLSSLILRKNSRTENGEFEAAIKEQLEGNEIFQTKERGVVITTPEMLLRRSDATNWLESISRNVRLIVVRKKDARPLRDILNSEDAPFTEKEKQKILNFLREDEFISEVGSDVTVLHGINEVLSRHKGRASVLLPDAEVLEGAAIIPRSFSVGIYDPAEFADMPEVTGLVFRLYAKLGSLIGKDREEFISKMKERGVSQNGIFVVVKLHRFVEQLMREHAAASLGAQAA